MGKKAKARALATAMAAKAGPKAAGVLPEAPARKLKNTVRRYVQHILICTDSKSKQCKRGGPEVRKAFDKAIKARCSTM